MNQSAESNFLSAAATQAAIIDEFAYFGDWTERYQYLIDCGHKLASYPEAAKTDEYKVSGCQSQVWLLPSGDAACLRFQGASDSAIVAGLVALLLRVYSARPAQEILATEPHFIESIGLARHLSPSRSNGLGAMLETIQRRAREALAASEATQALPSRNAS